MNFDYFRTDENLDDVLVELEVSCPESWILESNFTSEAEDCHFLQQTKMKYNRDIFLEDEGGWEKYFGN